MQQNWKFQRGDIFFTHFGASTGSEQHGDRPVVILQNDVGNYHSPTLIVATMTSKAEKKVNQPTHCLLENAGLNMPSVVQAEQIFTIDKSRALKYLGHLTPEEMRRVDDAVRISLALNPMGSIQQIEPIRRSTAAYAPPEVVDGKPPVYPYTPIKSSFERRKHRGNDAVHRVAIRGSCHDPAVGIQLHLQSQPAHHPEAEAAGG